jgi:hypothetical protein
MDRALEAGLEYVETLVTIVIDEYHAFRPYPPHVGAIPCISQSDPPPMLATAGLDSTPLHPLVPPLTQCSNIAEQRGK